MNWIDVREGWDEYEEFSYRRVEGHDKSKQITDVCEKMDNVTLGRGCMPLNSLHSPLCCVCMCMYADLFWLSLAP